MMVESYQKKSINILLNKRLLNLSIYHLVIKTKFLFNEKEWFVYIPWTLGLTVGDCRRNVQVSWASLGTRFAQNTPHSSPSSPTVNPRAPCCGRSRVPWLLANQNFAPGCISGQKHQGSEDTPLGRVQQTPCGLSPWADGREMWVKCAVVVMIPVRPGHNTHTFHPTCPNIRPKDSVRMESRHHPSGTPNPSTTEATWARVSVCKEPWHLRTTITQILWSNSWAWLAKCVDVLSIPGRTGMLKKPTRVTHQALLSDQGLHVVVVLCHHGPLQAENLARVASVGKTSRLWWKPPWGECSKLPADWVLGLMVGESGWNMWLLWLSLCTQGPSQHPTFHPTCPNFQPKDSICMESRHHPSGVSSDT